MTLENTRAIATLQASDDTGERGASLVEYALLVALIAIVSITAVSKLGTTVSDQFSFIEKVIQTGDVP